MTETIVRIAARGEGVTESGRHFPFAVPGDTIANDGSIVAGPHHQVPPCRHFPACGGCQLQHVDDAAYGDYLAARIAGALAQHGLVTKIREPHLSPPRSRRRASLRTLKLGQRAVIGFNSARSNQIVDLRECHILRPELFALVAPLRELLGALLKPRRGGEVQLAMADQGVDVLLKGVGVEGLAAIETLTEFCTQQQLARMSLDQGLGPEAFYEPVPVTATLSGRPVALPIGAFLQATEDGEAVLAAAVCEAVGEATRTADLFAGLGTFALALPGQVYAAEASRDAVLALKRAAPAIAVEHRDLYRRPLDVGELANFDVVVLDPPRAGAAEQVANLAASAVPRIAYVSCNPATYARDAKTLADGGYALAWVRPVGQFRWSTHVELAGCFTK
ncbi:class I SAM-dependent RNA methyltransferase [Sphingomonas sp.]|uniref:class I SAM-dependent RNA methyltransferase n=1 Tax=Sphingomonas sp. TaxID=28214 RepID=UPI00286C42EC|nr:class I SAM-dependent RNA methyltransferase [Sphingomonas sp.]